MDNRIPIQLVLDDRNFLLQAKRSIDSVQLKKSIEFDSAPLKRITGDFNEFGKSLDAAVARVISFTATTRLLQGFGNSIAGITKSAIEVENAMTRVQSILGTTASQTKQFKKDLFDLANSGSTDFYKVAEAAEEFSRQGFTLTKTIEATKAAMVLAKLSGTDLKKTIEGVTAVMATASNQTLEFIDVTDKIAAVDAKFATSSAGLLDGLKRFGGIAEQNGLVLDQQLGLLAAIKQLSGRSEAVIGNSIKSLLVSFSNSNIQKDLENIGVSVKDSEGNFKDLVQVGKELAAVYDTLSASQQAFIRQRVGGKFQADAFEQFVKASKNTGNGSLIDKAIGTSENSAGSSLKRIETLNTSTKSQLEVFKNTLTQFGDAIGSKLTKPVVDEFISIVNNLGSVFSNNSEVASVGEKIGNGIITGIKNVITQPGLVVGGVLLTNLIKKIGGDALKATTSILGVSKYKKDIAAIEQVQVATIMPKINEYDLKRIASLTTQADKEREILKILNDQIKARAAATQVNQFLNTVPGVTNINRSYVNPVKTKAEGGLPDAFFREAVDVSNGVGGATPHARPKKMMLNVGRGPETVVVNSDERIIRNFAGTGQDAVLNREMMGYATGRVPSLAIGRVYRGLGTHLNAGPGSLAGGYIGPTKRLLKHLGKRGVELYRDSTHSSVYSPLKEHRFINVNSKNPIVDLLHESGHDLDRKNLLSTSKKFAKNKTPIDIDTQISEERVANANALKLMKKLGYSKEAIDRYKKQAFRSFKTYTASTYPRAGVLRNISRGHISDASKKKIQDRINDLISSGKHGNTSSIITSILNENKGVPRSVIEQLVDNQWYAGGSGGSASSAATKRYYEDMSRTGQFYPAEEVKPSMGSAFFEPFAPGSAKPPLISKVTKGFKGMAGKIQNDPFTFSLSEEPTIRQTSGVGTFKPYSATRTTTSSFAGAPATTATITPAPLPASSISSLKQPFKEVFIDVFSDSATTGAMKKSFGESFRSGFKSVVSNSLGGGKIGNAVAGAPSFIIDAIESIRRPNSYIPKNKFFSKGLRDDLSKLPDSAIDSLSPYGDPNKATSQALREEIASKNEAYRDSIRKKKETRETNRSARSAKLAGVGFGASFFGGVASELLTGKNGEATAASRASNSIFQSVGLTASVASINPAIGAVVGAGLLVKETSNLVNEITAGGAYDSAAAAYKKLTDEVTKSESSIASFADAAAGFNDVMGSGNITQIENMVSRLADSYGKLPTSFSESFGSLNPNQKIDVDRIQKLALESQSENRRKVAQQEFELKFQEFRKGGSFGSRRNTTLAEFASSGDDAAEAFTSALLEGIDMSVISEDLKEKIRSGKDLSIQEFNSIIPESALKRDALTSPEFRESGSLSRYAVSKQLRKGVFGFDLATKQAEAAKKSLNLTSLIGNDLASFQSPRDRELDRAGLKLEGFSKAIDLSSDTLTGFGKSALDLSLSITKSKIELERNIAGKNKEFSSAALNLLSSRGLDIESANSSRGFLKSFSQDGDIAKLLTNLQSTVGKASIKEVEDLALKAMPELRRESELLSDTISSLRDSFAKEQKSLLINEQIRTFGAGKVTTPEQLSSIRDGIIAQLKPRKDFKSINAQFIDRGGFGVSDFNLSRGERAFKTVGANRANAALGEKSISSIQDLDSIGLLGIPTDPSTQLGRASRELRALSKRRVKRDFLDVSKSNQQNSVKSILDGYFSEINASSKKEQGFNLIPEDLRKSINQDIAFSDFGSAKNRVSQFSDSLPESNSNKALLEEVIRVLDINDIISKNSSEVASAFADKLIKNNSGDELLSKINDLVGIEAKTRDTIIKLEGYFANKFSEERTSLNSDIINKEGKVSSELFTRLQKAKSRLEDVTKDSGISSINLKSNLSKEISILQSKYNESQARIGAAKFDNIVNNKNGVVAGLSTEFSPLINAITGVSDNISNAAKSIGSSVTNPASKEVKVLQESVAKVLVGVDLQQIISGSEAIKEALSKEITNIVSTIFKENGFNIKTKPKQ